MDTQVLLFWTVAGLALVFDYINGFHDAANAIATVVSTRVLTPKQAVLMGAVLNLAGALAGTAVAETIGKGMVEGNLLTIETLLAAMLSAIAWNLLTWWWGLPSSSSHALIGALLGATFVHAQGNGIHWHAVFSKIIVPMVASPLAGFSIGFLLMLVLTWLVSRLSLSWINRVFGKLQLVSAGWMAYSHGHNDAQKSMGIIALAASILYPHKGFVVEPWIMISCAIAMGLGTMSGGWKIIRTLGSKMIKLQPIHGFAAETTAALVITGASSLGIPLSTTHVITTSIMGVGSTRRLSAIKWPLVSRILWAWVLSLPITFVLAGLLYWAVKLAQTQFS
jgi:inorganic phosphate transporter, PiT family